MLDATIGKVNRPKATRGFQPDTVHSAATAVVNEAAWRRRLLNLASHLLLGEEPVSFNSLVRAMAGADPVLVRSLLVELTHMQSSPAHLRAVAALADSERVATTPTATIDPCLPAPHPLDYEWRFTPRTREQLVATILAHAPQSVLLLGCPTVALSLLSRRPEIRITLVDDNPALPLLSDLVEHDNYTYKQLRADLVARPEVTAGLSADVVIADAPFYKDAMAGFLRAAVTGAQHGAHLIFALPPIGSRPSAETDVRSFINLTSRAGLRHITTTSGSMRYLSPSFEVKAHRSAGLLSIEEDWRAADSAVFQLEHSASLTAMSVFSDRGCWREVLVRGKRWRVRAGHSTRTTVNGLLQNVTVGSALDSVSRRDERRNGANVCTEDNEFFVTGNPDLLLDILCSIDTGRDPVEQAEESLGRALSSTECIEVNLAHDVIQPASPVVVEVG